MHVRIGRQTRVTISRAWVSCVIRYVRQHWIVVLLSQSVMKAYLPSQGVSTLSRCCGDLTPQHSIKGIPLGTNYV